MNKTIIISIVILITIFVFIKKDKQEEVKTNPYIQGYLQKKELLLSLKQQSKYHIIMIGDSLTAGENWGQALGRHDILNMGQGSDTTEFYVNNQN